MAQLEIRDLRVVYRSASGLETLAVDGVSLAVERGEFVTIVGPSGCGKSTMLMVIDGLLPRESGDVLVNGKPVDRPGPDRAVVFQEFALLPWRTALENVCFGLEFRGVPPAERAEVARRYIRLVGLDAFERHYPHQLSGGMRQRIGIARALAVRPEILLMDEPFGALDAQTREIMSAELLRIWGHERKTVLFVTHSIEEAIYLADRVVVLTARPARVKQVVPIDLPRPREPGLRNEARFIAYRKLIWDLLEDEVKAAMAEEEAPA